MDKILIIEDDVEINTLLTDFLKENGYVVYSQYDGPVSYTHLTLPTNSLV